MQQFRGNIFSKQEKVERLAFGLNRENGNVRSRAQKMLATVTNELEINDDEVKKYKLRAQSLLIKYGRPYQIPIGELVSEKATVYLDDAKLLAYCMILEETQKLK